MTDKLGPELEPLLPVSVFALIVPCLIGVLIVALLYVLSFA